MKYIKVLLVALIAIVIGSAFFLHLHEKKYERYFMLFKDKVTGEIEIENRYVAVSEEKDSLNVFVEEFLLGPVNHNLISFFPHGMKYNTLIFDNGVLYVDLPKDSVLHMPKDVQFEEFYNLFIKSIKINFPTLKDVRIFIGGSEAYEKKRKA